MPFDPDRFINDTNSRKTKNLSDETFKLPHFKVPANNLMKLGFEKKIVSIVLDIKIKDPKDK